MKKLFCYTLLLLIPLSIFVSTGETNQKITANDGHYNDFFGYSVAISGDHAIVGAYEASNETRNNSGAAYIFKKVGNSWSLVGKYFSDYVGGESQFGVSVSISGNYAIVGAPGNAIGSTDPSAYILKKDGDTWSIASKLTAPDIYFASAFGQAVSISGDYAIVGAAHDVNGVSSAYIFQREGETWNLTTKLIANDASALADFGDSVSISGDYAIVGAYKDEINGMQTGSAYIFKRDGTVWNQTAKLTAFDGANIDLFGRSVSISGDYAIVGADGDDDNGTRSGSAYIFKREGEAWSFAAKLTANDGLELDEFGTSVSISGDYAVIGANGNDYEGDSPDSAYIFKKDGVVWRQISKMVPSNAGTYSNFGVSVAISGNDLIVGAYTAENNGEPTGAAYMYSLNSNLTQTQASQLYVSIFGRASEGEGNEYWCSNQGNMTDVAAAMLNTTAAQEYFGDTLNDHQQFIEFIYENTLGKTYAEDPNGIDYWVSELAAGKSKAQVATALINAVVDPQYTGTAAQIRFNNRVEVSNYTASKIESYTDRQTFAGFISGVTDASETVASAKLSVDNL